MCANCLDAAPSWNQAVEFSRTADHVPAARARAAPGDAKQKPNERNRRRAQGAGRRAERVLRNEAPPHSDPRKARAQGRESEGLGGRYGRAAVTT